MNKNGPIIVIEDDLDDQEMLKQVFKELNYPNKVIYFSEAHEALDYLIFTSLKPFIILSDINMPKLNGFQLRELIQNSKE